MTTPTSHIMDHGDYHTGAGRSSPAEQQLSLSIYCCDANEEDEEGVLMRYGSHGHLADQDNESIYSAPCRTRTNASDESHRQSIVDKDLTHEDKKIPREKIKDAINGMRRADENAQLQRSTRRFLAMSEAQRTPQTLTQTICLSPWCDFSHGRGMALMLGAVSLCLITAVVLGSQGRLGLGIGTSISGVSIILVRRFWVPLYWLVWGQFVEKRRRRNMQLYDTLHGDHRGRALSVLNITSVENIDDREIEFSNDNGLANVVGEKT